MNKMDLEADFKPVTIDDLPEIQKYLEKSGYEESNHNLVNMIHWIEWYPLFQYKKEDVFICTGSRWHFCIPYNNDTNHLVGTTMPAPEYYRE